MTVKEYLKSKISEFWPNAAILAANGASLAKFKRDAEVDDEELTLMLSFWQFQRKVKYSLEDGGSRNVEDYEDPVDVLVFRLIVRFPDDENFDADGYDEIIPLVSYLREQAQFRADDGKLYEIDVSAGSAITEEEFAEDVFEIFIEVG